MTVMRIEIDDASDAFVYVDVVDATGRVEQLARRDNEVPFHADKLAAALDKVVPALSLVVDKLQHVDPAIDEIGVQVGLTFTAETGLVLVRGSTGATFQVTLGWRRPAGGAAPPAELGKEEDAG